MAEVSSSPAPKLLKKVKKPAKPTQHPPYAEMIKAAVEALKERSGTSRQAILKYITANYDVGDNANTHVKLALKRMVASGHLLHTKGIGASGSFKLNKAKTEKKKVAKQPVVKATPKKKAASKTRRPVAKPKPKKSPGKKSTTTAKKPVKSTAKKAKAPVAKTPKKTTKAPAKKGTPKAKKTTAKPKPKKTTTK